MKTDISIFRRQRRILLEPFDCEGILSLLNAGFSLRQCLHVLEDERNTECFAKMRSQLENGEPGDRVMTDFCPDKYRRYLEGFIQVLPVKKALGLSIRMANARQASRKQYLSQAAYPLSMFLLMLCGCLLFSEFCFPALLSMMEGFRIDLSFYSRIASAVRLVSSSLLAFVIIVLILTAVCTRRKYRIKAYCFIASKGILPVIREYVSARFILFYTQCIEMDLHTMQSLQILKSLDSQPLIRMLAAGMDEALRDGNAFEEAMHSRYLDPSLYRFMRIAVHTEGAGNMMNSYLQMSSLRMQRKLKRYSEVIRLVSYAGVGVMLIIVYRILMMPLSVLSDI
ncbi:MAG: type II secretion system F family protein [Solobacterium sp.]|nr:type II secretion system F family protein [Solobacterium sp.]